MEEFVQELHRLNAFLFLECLHFQQIHHSVSDIDYSHVYTNQHTVSSLKKLCVKKLVTADVLSRMNCLDLPEMIKNILIQHAISCGSVKSVTALLNAWRHERFVYEVPVPFRTWLIFVECHSLKIFSRISKLSSFVELITEHFITSLTSNFANRSPVQCLDFSAVPISGPHLEQFFKLLENCRVFSESSDFENASIAENMKCLDVQVPPNKCVIKLNCVVKYKEDINLLLRVLSHLRGHDTPLDLLVVGVHIATINIPSNKVFELLNSLEPKALDIFSYSTQFSPHSVDHLDIMRKLTCFPNLRALSLQLRSVNLAYHRELLFELCDLLHQMVNLKHFSLALREVRNPFRMHESVPLRQRFVNVQLECLALMDCGLSAGDIMSLFAPVQTLKTLNISCAQFDLQKLIPMLTECKNLRILILKNCKFTGGNIDLLFHTFSTMKKLKCLNIDSMDVSVEVLLKQALHISCMPSLQFLSISSIFDEELDDGYDFQEEFQCALESLWSCPSRRIIMF